jgi:hypothetical protein
MLVTMKPLLVLFIALLAPLAFGTAQDSDSILLDGKKSALFENPLEMLWLGKDGRPMLFSDSPGLELETKGAVEYLHGRPAVFTKEGVRSSANWRGYVATWEVRESKLFLTKVEKTYRKDFPKDAAKPPRERRFETEVREVPIEKIIPGKKVPVFADWYSGKLRIPQGERIRYVHMGYGSMYERDLFIVIKNGVVVSRVEVSNSGKNLYRSTPDLQWCALGKEVEDKGGWIDARMLATKRIQSLLASGETFKTRGVFFKRSEKGIAAALTIFETPKTESDSFPLHSLPENVSIGNGSHVEVEGHFVKAGESYELRVSSIRELVGGETMHAASFPEEWEKLQAEAESSQKVPEKEEHVPTDSAK